MLLLPEAVLAQRFHVSRVSMREAVRLLVGRGLIEVRMGGLFVASASPKPVSDALTLLLRRQRAKKSSWRCGGLLEVEIAALAAQRATEDDLVQMAAVLGELGATSRPVEDTAADACLSPGAGPRGVQQRLPGD